MVFLDIFLKPIDPHLRNLHCRYCISHKSTTHRDSDHWLCQCSKSIVRHGLTQVEIKPLVRSNLVSNPMRTLVTEIWPYFLPETREIRLLPLEIFQWLSDFHSSKSQSPRYSPIEKSQCHLPLYFPMENTMWRSTTALSSRLWPLALPMLSTICQT